MTQFLPPNLLALFAPRDPIPYLPPPDKLPHEKKTSGYTGVSTCLQYFEDPKDTPPPGKIQTREERMLEKRKQQAELIAYKLERDIAMWHPQSNNYATTDPFKSLFVARVNYDTSESKLRREFELYGPVKKIIITHDKNNGKSRGYAFIEYERERDMHSAYKHADGKKIDGRRVLVDVERGRTVKGWLPRRLGGGIGGTRRGGPDVNVKHSGREESRADDRYADRDRTERIERRRSRSRSRERRRRSRSRERHPRGDRHKRDRSRDRERNRDAEPNVGNNHMADNMGESERGAVVQEQESSSSSSRKERRRSRSRDKERRRRRSRSRDRGKRRDHDRDRESRRQERADREERMRDRGEEENPPMDDNNNNSNNNNDVNAVTIKEEPEDEPFESSGYEGNDFSNYVGGAEEEESGGYNLY